MPTVSISRDLLYEELGHQYTDEEFDELCFEFGIEVDDIVDDPEKGITLKIEVGANRYDLLCLEGISRALNIFIGKSEIPNFKILPAQLPLEYQLMVQPNVAAVRPFIVGAVLRDITFNKNIYNSFIDLQDKLHQNLARKRTLVAIGTHDLDTINGPFTYDAEAPESIAFVPLNGHEELTSDLMLEQFANDAHLKDYVHIIKDKPLYPVIRDRSGIVLSLPPIINGDHSKITLNTRNVLIECTGVDFFKTQVVLDTVVCMFSQYCQKPFTVEPVEVTYPNGDRHVFPALETRHVETSAAFCNRIAGVSETPHQIAQYLAKMGLRAKHKGQDTLDIVVPPTRYDVLHECDIAEDFAVAYGFDRLCADMRMPPTNTIGKEFNLNYLSDKVRALLAQNNYTEAATFSLCSMADLGSRLRVDLSKDGSWVRVANPKTQDTEAVRTTLLPGLLRTLAANKHVPMPIKLFEVSDVVVRDARSSATRGVGARNERHLCAVNCNVRGGVELVQGLLDNLMIAFGIPYKAEAKEGQTGHYYLKEEEHGSFFPGWCGSVMVGETRVGRVGLLHPEVITNFTLTNPASALELDLEKLLPFSKL